MRHLLAIRDLEVKDIQDLLELAADIKKNKPTPSTTKSSEQRVLGMLFFENSTRTRVSFEQAARGLGMQYTSFGVTGSSIAKGESLKDTVITLRSTGVDALVMRHDASGAPYLAAKFFNGPVINAGDGMHEHPTQALADAMTILEHFPSVKGLRISIVGDIFHSRVARSNIWLLSKLGAEVRLVGPRTLLPRYPGGLPASLYSDLATGIANADVVMALRLQKERMGDGLISSVSEYASQFQINSRTIRIAKPECLVMHPGPINRGLELDDAVADGKNSVISEQVENGVFVRMAALKWAFSNKLDNKAAVTAKGAKS